MHKAKNPEEQAILVLEDLQLGNKLPIDVEGIAKALNVPVKYEPFEEELSGVIIKEPGRIVIGINSGQAYTRQRFTIAHELGHHLLGHAGEIFVDKTLRHQATIIRRDAKSSLGVNADEIQANQFAAELLMPKNLVSEQVGKRIKKNPRIRASGLIEDLAGTFKVSAQAMEIRLTNLGYLIPD